MPWASLSAETPALLASYSAASTPDSPPQRASAPMLGHSRVTGSGSSPGETSCRYSRETHSRSYLPRSTEKSSGVSPEEYLISKSMPFRRSASASRSPPLRKGAQLSMSSRASFSRT